MKKIAFIMGGTIQMPFKNGAVEGLVDLLINSNKVNGKYKIDVYSNGNRKNYTDGNINYYYVNCNNKIMKLFRFLFNKIFNKYIGNLYISNLIKKYKNKLKKYDYVIVENKPMYGLVLRKYINGKLILHSHNDISKYKNRLKDIIDSYDRIFTVSDYMYKQINSDKCRLLYNGIDINKFNKSINVIREREKLGLKKDDIVFLYTSRVVKHKGIIELIEAFNKINKDNYKLLVVGDYLKTNNKNILYIGYVDYSNIEKYYLIADYGIVPSLCEEAFGLVVIENLASGNPVIITNSGGMVELVDDKCSVVVNKNNLVNNLYEAISNINKKKFNKEDLLRQANLYNKDKYIDYFIKLIEEK